MIRFLRRLRIAWSIYSANRYRSTREYCGGWIKWRTAWCAAKPWGEKP